MNKRCLILTLVLSCAMGVAGRAFDTIKSGKTSLLGNVVDGGMDSTKVELQQSSGVRWSSRYPPTRST